MVLLDTNVFVIDRFFRRDERYEVNRRLVAKLPRMEAGFCIFSLFELCGISSFNLSPEELKRWSYHFDEVYSVEILEPRGLYAVLAVDWFARFSNKMANCALRLRISAAESAGVPYRFRTIGYLYR